MHFARDRFRAALVAGACAAALVAVAAPAAASSLTQIAAQLVVTGVTEPLYGISPDGDARLFLVERAGRIVILESGAIRPTPFLDVTDRVLLASERGFLGLAFDPDYASNGRFFVYYTNLDSDMVLSRFTVSADPNVADPTETILLTVAEPAVNHNGGTVTFGPDGFLYLGLGDGGGSNDPAERAQNLSELLGKMLRLDVGVPPLPGSIPGPGGTYAIPADNPFVGVAGARAEIWALGLRNPYRFSFDRETGDLWIADVGQGAIEEIDFEPADDPGGRNYGWDVEEGSTCNTVDPAPAPPCGDPSLTRPVHEYGHTGGNCSVTGGFVHRGGVPAVEGHYLFGDYCSGRVWSLDGGTLQVTERTAELGAAGAQTNQLAGFGEDGLGNTYVVLRNGRIYRIVPGAPECGDGLDNDGDGKIDTADPGCFDDAWPEEDPACNNGADDDGDGLIDTDDPQCSGPWDLAEGKRGCGLSGGEALAVLLALRARRPRPAARG